MIKNQKNHDLRVAIIGTALISFYLLSSCSDSLRSTQTGTSTDILSPKLTGQTATSAEENTPIFKATQSTEAVTATQATAIRSNSQYTFTAGFDYNKHSLDVTESIQYTNKTGQTLSEIKMAVPPNQFEGEFILKAISLNEAADDKNYTLDGVTLTLNLSAPLGAGDSIRIGIQYSLKIPNRGSILGYTALQTNLSDWYPFIAPFDPQTGWILHQPSSVGEYLVYDVADFDLTLTLSGPRGMIVASSTEAVPTAQNSYHLNELNSRNLTFSVSDQYVPLEKKFGDVTVHGYVFAGDEGSGRAAMENTGTALQYFSDLFGVAYPHQTMTFVESDFTDGIEYDGLYYLSRDYFKKYDGTIKNYLSLLSVHETAHQWWFGIVGNDQANEPWLDESMATYSEYLYIETYYPDLTDWWWQYRVDTYHPSGRVDLTIYDQSDLRKYINAVYLQGARFLDELRQTQGDEAFFANLRNYVETYKFRIVKWRYFIAIFNRDQSEATTAIIQKYFKN